MAETAAQGDTLRQAQLCLGRGCAILESYIDAKLEERGTIEAGGLVAVPEGILPDTELERQIADEYKVFVDMAQTTAPSGVAPRSHERDQGRARRALRERIAVQFVEAGFCRETIAASPQQQRDAGHAGECVWLDRQIDRLK